MDPTGAAAGAAGPGLIPGLARAQGLALGPGLDLNPGLDRRLGLATGLGAKSVTFGGNAAVFTTVVIMVAAPATSGHGSDTRANKGGAGGDCRGLLLGSASTGVGARRFGEPLRSDSPKSKGWVWKTGGFLGATARVGEAVCKPG